MFAQAGPQFEYPRRAGFQRRWTVKPNVPQPSGQPKQGKPVEKSEKTSTTVGAKRKVTPMAARAWSKSSLNLEQERRQGKKVYALGAFRNISGEIVH